MFRTPRKPKSHRTQITQKFLGEVVEMGRFIMALGLGGVLTWVLTVQAASPAANLHTFNGTFGVLCGIAFLGLVLWILGAVVKPDPLPGPPGPTGPTGPPGQGVTLPRAIPGGRGSASVEALPGGGTVVQWEDIPDGS